MSSLLAAALGTWLGIQALRMTLAMVIWNVAEDNTGYAGEVAVALWRGFASGVYVQHLGITMAETVMGFVLGSALGFFLGMRHATDPDHVVAVTTIVSQQRSLARAARTGVLWGIGHTATILLAGGVLAWLAERR